MASRSAGPTAAAGDLPSLRASSALVRGGPAPTRRAWPMLGPLRPLAIALLPYGVHSDTIGTLRNVSTVNHCYLKCFTGNVTFRRPLCGPLPPLTAIEGRQRRGRFLPCGAGLSS